MNNIFLLYLLGVEINVLATIIWKYYILEKSDVKIKDILYLCFVGALSWALPIGACLFFVWVICMLLLETLLIPFACIIVCIIESEFCNLTIFNNKECY
jgi:hypothetical protein